MRSPRRRRIEIRVIASAIALGLMIESAFTRDDRPSAAVSIRAGTADEFQEHINKGSRLIDAGKYDEAIAEFRAAIKINPDDARSHVRLAGLLIKSEYGANDEAISELRTALRLDPDYQPALSNLVRALTEDGKTREATIEAYKLIQKYPNMVTSHITMGNLYAETGEFAKAIAEYREAMKLDPAADAPHVCLAFLYNKRAQFNDAIIECRQAVRLHPETHWNHSVLATALGLSGRFDEAIVSLRTAIRLRPGVPADRLILAEALASSGLFDDAIAQEREALRSGAKDAEKIRQRIENFVEQHHRRDEAILRLRADLTVDPHDAYSHYRLGNELKNLCKFDEALAQFRAAAANKPGFDSALIEIGKILEMRGKHREAIVEYRRALQADRQDVDESRYALGLGLITTGEYVEALRVLKKVHELNYGLSNWRHSSDYAIETCTARAELEKRLPAILAGKDRPENAFESLDAARICVNQRRYVSACRLFDDAFSSIHDLADDPASDALHAAARANLLASLGAGIEPVDVAARIGTRARAIVLLDHELSVCENEKTLNHYGVKATLYRLLNDDVFSGFRNDSALAGFPKAERAAWSAIWRWVSDLDRFDPTVKIADR